MESFWKWYITFGLFLAFLPPSVVTRVNKAQAFKCPPHKFKCAGEKCIPAVWKCDGDDDCGDGSDENSCPVRKCDPKRMFTCGDGKCVPIRWKCDGEKDCADASDEKSCPKPTCKKDFFRCNNSRCIPSRWKCDKQDDCGDKSDEHSCPAKPGTCDKTKDAQCTDGSCISSKWLCDGENDCSDGSDERNCTTKVRKCRAKEFTCSHNRQCIPSGWRCDGSTDCYDKTDEDNCPKKATTCGALFWTCDNGDCIKKDWRCDGEKDCRDGSDEKNCKHVKCSIGKFKCLNESKCIPLASRCNNKTDCADGSDEMKCSTSKNKRNCTAEDYSCSEHECVTKDKVCDGRRDCLNGEDEPKNCYINECRFKNGHCSHNCTDLLVGYACTCPKGYKLDTDDRTCVDIDECQSYGMCHQKCQNFKGRYKCLCDAGYEIMRDRKTCKAVGMDEWIYFSNRVDIRRVSANGKTYEIVVSAIRGAVSIDFHMKKKKIFWTDILMDQIQSASIDSTGVRQTVYSQTNRSVVMKHVHTPDGLAVDWVNDKLYWTDTGFKSIEVSDLNGDNNMDVVDVGLNEPRAICVDPSQGFIYWTDWGSSAAIERVSMDGANGTRKKIIDSNIYWPNGLTLDLHQGKVYWIDAKLKRMEVANLDGTNRMVLMDTGFKHPFAIDNFAENVYWTDWKSDKLRSMAKFDDHKIDVIKNGLFAPMDVKVFHKSKQPPIKNLCGEDKNGCSHLCLLANIDGKPSSSCKCPRGMKLVNLQTCEGSQVSHKSRQSKPVTKSPKTPKPTQSSRVVVSTASPKVVGQPKIGAPIDSNAFGTGPIVAIIIAIFIIAICVIGFVIWRRRRYGKTNVKYYKDMSKKPLEDDFDIVPEDDDLAQIENDLYDVET